MNDNTWSLAGKFVAAIIVLCVVMALATAAYGQHARSHALPLVEASVARTCIPLPPRCRPAGHVDCNANPRNIA